MSAAALRWGGERVHVLLSTLQAGGWQKWVRFASAVAAKRADPTPRVTFACYVTLNVSLGRARLTPAKCCGQSAA